MISFQLGKMKITVFFPKLTNQVEYAIPSLKFAPFYERDQNAKDFAKYYFSCFSDEAMQQFVDNGMNHVEGLTSKYSQLKYLAIFLRACYIESLLTREMPFYKVVQRKRSQILADDVLSFQYYYVFYLFISNRTALQEITSQLRNFRSNNL